MLNFCTTLGRILKGSWNDETLVFTKCFCLFCFVVIPKNIYFVENYWIVTCKDFCSLLQVPLETIWRNQASSYRCCHTKKTRTFTICYKDGKCFSSKCRAVEPTCRDINNNTSIWLNLGFYLEMSKFG